MSCTIYYLYINGELEIVTASKKVLEQTMDERVSIGSLVEVLDQFGNNVPEYIPF